MPRRVDATSPRPERRDPTAWRRRRCSAGCDRGSSGSARSADRRRAAPSSSLVAGGWWLLRSPAPPTEAGLPHAGASTSTSRRPPVPAAPADQSTAPTTGRRPRRRRRRRARRVRAAGRGTGASQPLDAAGGAALRGRPRAPSTSPPCSPTASGSTCRSSARRRPAGVAGRAGSSVDAGRPGRPQPGDGRRARRRCRASGRRRPRPSSTIATANGPFASVDDLEAVRGIGPAKLEALRGLVTV